jgi:hypothetical protein
MFISQTCLFRGSSLLKFSLPFSNRCLLASNLRVHVKLIPHALPLTRLSLLKSRDLLLEGSPQFSQLVIVR